MNGGIHSGMALEDALTSGSSVTRTMARCAVSGWIEQLSAWVNDEVMRPDGDPMVVVQAMSIVFIQTIGSVAAQVSKPSGDLLLKNAVISIVEEQLLRHMEMTRKAGRP